MIWRGRLPRVLVPALVLLALALVLVVVAAGCGGSQHNASRGTHRSTPPPQAAPRRQRLPDLGVYERSITSSYAQVSQFAAMVGRRPNIVLDYSGWGWRWQFPLGIANRAQRHGATPLIQLQPNRISIAAIADGQYDAYLRAYAREVRRFGHRVIIGFAHEMNGPWYTWGWTHVPPHTWIRAWRHVVSVFRSQGARNVVWLWTVHHDYGSMRVIRQYWPGKAWVNWVGIDGYFEKPTDTYYNIFGGTVKGIRTFTYKPILLSEVGAGPATGRQGKDITALFAGIRRQHLLGLVWFDAAQNAGLHHQDWRLENSPVALRDFRAAMRRYGFYARTTALAAG
jgi:mannan endo-1,4-beta-mannosidase